MIQSTKRSLDKLKTVRVLVQKEMDKVFEFLKMLHTNSHVFSGGELVSVESMKAKFLSFIDEVGDLTKFQVSRIDELSAVSAVIKREAEKMSHRIAKLDELTEMHDLWMIRAEKCYDPR